MQDTCVVFLTHLWSEAIARRFERLKREASPMADVFLLVQDDDPQVVDHWKSTLQSIGSPGAMFRFGAAALPDALGLRYFGLRQVLSNVHFPLLLFSRTQTYAHYWHIEYDVELRGGWRELLEAYRPSAATLIAAHFHNYSEWPDWHWWTSITTPTGRPPVPESLYKAFLPIARFSKQALDEVLAAHKEGWLGHYEAVVPTVLLANGHNLEDLNVRARCYVGPYQDPAPLLALQSTIRARPPVTLPELSSRGQGALLFHPVKDPWVFDGHEVKVLTG